MNTPATSREAILEVCRKMVSEHGLTAVDMRSVASACNVALGSLYNYFPSKDELLIATIESVWKDIFHMENCQSDLRFPEYVEWIFQSVHSSASEYPNFFSAHSISLASFGRNKAKDMMNQYVSHMKQGLLRVLSEDEAVRDDAFSRSFTESQFMDFILGSLMMLLVQRAKNCNVLIEIVRRTIYTRLERKEE